MLCKAIAPIEICGGEEETLTDLVIEESVFRQLVVSFLLITWDADWT